MTNHRHAVTFALAPMSPAFRWLTIALFGLPVLFLVLAWRGELPFVVLFGVLALYLATYVFWRPTRFDVSRGQLDVVFPGWTRRLQAHTLAGARAFTLADFRREFGWGLRIGIGGLWGGFGWLWTRRGLVEFYISRTDGFVLVERRHGRPLLITPERPEAFVEALRAALGAEGAGGRPVQP
jgi:hypothetical protein